MIRLFLLSTAALIALASCASEPEKKPVGPTSDTSNISWTGQVTNPIQGQFGMLPQNQHRR